MSRAEKLALENLASDDSIIIKPADKGGAIVVMNRTDYIAEARQQLGNENAYCKCRSDPTPHVQSLMLTVLREALALGVIDNNLFLYLQTEHPFLGKSLTY